MIEHIEPGTLPANIKACIALTSWKKRINTVGQTIYSLFAMCGPEFHIVLTLAEEEFPKKELELPRDLVLMNRVGMFEILWVKKNWKSFKKWIFCGVKYPQLPIITADDDCIYTTNFANELYKAYVDNTTYKVISWIGSVNSGQGLLIASSPINNTIISHITKLPLTSIDSCLIAYIAKYNVPYKKLGRTRCTLQHTNIMPINMAQYSNVEQYKLIQQIYQIL